MLQEQTSPDNTPETAAAELATRDECNDLHNAATNRLNEALVDNTEPYTLDQLEGYDQFTADGEEAYTQTLELGDTKNPLTISRRVYGKHLHSVTPTAALPSLHAHPVDRMITIGVPHIDEATGASKPVEILVINDGPTPEGVTLDARASEGNKDLSAATAHDVTAQIAVLGTPTAA